MHISLITVGFVLHTLSPIFLKLYNVFLDEKSSLSLVVNLKELCVKMLAKHTLRTKRVFIIFAKI